MGTYIWTKKAQEDIEKIREDIDKHIHKVFGDYASSITEEFRTEMVEDVMQTSAIEDEGFYSDGDIGGI